MAQEDNDEAIPVLRGPTSGTRPARPVVPSAPNELTPDGVGRDNGASAPDDAPGADGRVGDGASGDSPDSTDSPDDATVTERAMDLADNALEKVADGANDLRKRLADRRQGSSD